MNIVGLTGRLCVDPELKTTPSGKSVCSFNIAVNRPGTKDTTDFFTIVSWNEKAEFVSRYFHKGQKIEVAGILTERKWTDKNGNKRSKVEIKAANVNFGESKKSESDNTESAAPVNDDFTEITDDEDLPF